MRMARDRLGPLGERLVDLAAQLAADCDVGDHRGDGDGDGDGQRRRERQARPEAHAPSRRA